jgi:hypothetical protein
MAAAAIEEIELLVDTHGLQCRTGKFRISEESAL